MCLLKRDVPWPAQGAQPPASGGRVYPSAPADRRRQALAGCCSSAAATRAAWSSAQTVRADRGGVVHLPLSLAGPCPPGSLRLVMKLGSCGRAGARGRELGDRDQLGAAAAALLEQVGVHQAGLLDRMRAQQRLRRRAERVHDPEQARGRRTTEAAAASASTLRTRVCGRRRPGIEIGVDGRSGTLERSRPVASPRSVGEGAAVGAAVEVRVEQGLLEAPRARRRGASDDPLAGAVAGVRKMADEVHLRGSDGGYERWLVEGIGNYGC